MMGNCIELPFIYSEVFKNLSFIYFTLIIRTIERETIIFQILYEKYESNVNRVEFIFFILQNMFLYVPHRTKTFSV